MVLCLTRAAGSYTSCARTSFSSYRSHLTSRSSCNTPNLHSMPCHHRFVDSVGDAVDTHVHIDQSYLVVPQQQLAVQLYHLLARHMREEPEFKVGTHTHTPYMGNTHSVGTSCQGWETHFTGTTKHRERPRGSPLSRECRTTVTLACVGGTTVTTACVWCQARVLHGQGESSWGHHKRIHRSCVG